MAEQHDSATAIDSFADPRDYYKSSEPPTNVTSPRSEEAHIDVTKPPPTTKPSMTDYTHAPPPSASRSFSRSPTRPAFRSVSGPASSSNASLPTSRSSPSFLPPGRSQQRSIKDLVNRFNQAPNDQSPTDPNTRDRSRKAAELRGNRLQKARMPSNEPPSFGANKLYNRRGPASVPGSGSDSSSSFPRNPRSLDKGFDDSRITSPSKRKIRKPLFGEVVPDRAGMYDAGYGIPAQRPRRGSESSLIPANSRLQHGRSQSNAEFHQSPSLPSQSPPSNGGQFYKASFHQRSQSDLTGTLSQNEINFITNGVGSIELQPTNPAHLSSPERRSRIPVSTRSLGSRISPSPESRRTTPGSGHARNYFPQTNGNNTHRYAATGKENTPTRVPVAPLNTLPARRYDPAANKQTQNNQSLKAYISAPVPMKSPPLRSSRPRQPVSAATAGASRGKVAERFSPMMGSDPFTSSGPKPQTRRKKIPELGKVDFAERRARIQRAISQNLREDDTSSQGSVSRKSSIASSIATNRHSLVDFPENTLPTIPATPAATGDEQKFDDQLASASPEQGLKVHVNDLPQPDSEPLTGHTEFELEDSPVLGKNSANGEVDSRLEVDDRLTHGPSAGPEPSMEKVPSKEKKTEERHSNHSETHIDAGPSTLLDHVMRMRERSTSSASRTDFADDSASEIDDGGSIRIMLDDDAGSVVQEHPWEQDNLFSAEEAPQQGNSAGVPGLERNVEDFFADEPPEKYLDGATESVPETPRKVLRPSLLEAREDEDSTPRQSYKNNRANVSTIASIDNDAYAALNRIHSQYQASGSMSPEMLHEFRQHVLKPSPDLAKLGGSDAATIQVMLDNLPLDKNVANGDRNEENEQLLAPATYCGPQPLFDSSSDEEMKGTAIIYTTTSSSDIDLTDESNSQLEMDPRAWRRQSDNLFGNGEQLSSSRYELADATGGAENDDLKPPPPPPKDDGYSPSPRSSVGYSSDQGPPAEPRLSHRLSQPLSHHLTLPEIDNGSGLGLAISVDPPAQKGATAPPLPGYSPPPPPSQPMTWVFTDAPPSESATSSLPTSPASPNVRFPEEFYNSISTAPTRPSTDSQKPDSATLPPSVSMSSFQSSLRKPSVDQGQSHEGAPTAEQRRLNKRRNIIKELVDTENSYHQDMKIIEDIYKATVGDLITPDDKKALFGNADEVEAFSLTFYDALRKAVASVYVPPKSSRWQTKRGSFSTANSVSTDQTSEQTDDERDMKTTVGEVFSRFIPKMEKVYGAYLKNHDLANQRLSKLQTDATVKCWLAECHNNASDITSAWDLDSLLVKPVQRILKYPLLLQQLLESTPADHPDRKMLESAVKETMNVSQRINEAKKRADLVEAIVNRKRKESDVRSGIAKAFGRRTEKLKERVGIAEAYQDPEFDELAHKFGGHFIRLQVCMRDVQGSLAETDRAVERFNAFAQALEAYIDVGQSIMPEIESKWRKYALAIRELTAVALPEHKAAIKKHVIEPMIMAIKLHEGPQNAMSKRKKRIVDYAKCKAIEKRGEKPDKKTQEQSELYEALNEQLKIDLPRLYILTADLIQACLARLVDIQKTWHWTWERKLGPVLERFPENLAQIVPDFVADHDIIHSQLLGLGICNGSMLAESANFLSPQSTIVAEDSSGRRRPSESRTSRTLSVNSEQSPSLSSPDLGRPYGAGHFTLSPMDMSMPPLPNGQYTPGGRMRSSSSLSNRSNSARNYSAGLPPPLPRAPSGPTTYSTQTPKSSFSASRPSTANRPADLVHTPAQSHAAFARASADTNRSSRPVSGASYFTAQQDRYPGSGSMFSSAMPMGDGSGPMSPKEAPPDTPVMFVAASLFEFNIDRARREAGYPYLTYVQGEVNKSVRQLGYNWNLRRLTCA